MDTPKALDPSQVMETLARGVVAHSSPAVVKREGPTTLVIYTLPPLTVALRVEEEKVDFVFASCTVAEGLLQVLEGDGSAQVETAERSFPIDSVLQSDIYTTILEDFKSYGDELEALSP